MSIGPYESGPNELVYKTLILFTSASPKIAERVAEFREDVEATADFHGGAVGPITVTHLSPCPDGCQLIAGWCLIPRYNFAPRLDGDRAPRVYRLRRKIREDRPTQLSLADREDVLRRRAKYNGDTIGPVDVRQEQHGNDRYEVFSAEGRPAEPESLAQSA